jgi:transitional endoplasmic reticulum ATPase
MPLPTFWKTIEERYKSGLSHVFLLYFNINDIIYDDVYGYIWTRDYLLERMNYLGCDAVLYYTRSEGVLFPNVGLRNAYQSALRFNRIEEIEPLPVPPEGMDAYPTKNINSNLRRVGEEKQIKEPQEMMSLIERFFRQGLGNLKVGFLVQDIEKLLPNRKSMPAKDQEIIDLEIWQRWANDLQFRFRGHIVLLLTENISNVAPELITNEQSAIYPVEMPMPTYQERLAFIRHLLYIAEGEGEEGMFKLSLPEGVLSEEFAIMTHGLNLMDITNLWMTGRTKKTQVTPAMVVQHNRESIKTRGYGRLELVYGEHGLNTVGNLSNVIDYMTKVINSLKNWDSKGVPKGILMVGPPGTGKTNLVNALGRDMGIHIVKLHGLRGSDPTTRGDWDLHRAFDIIRSLTPLIVFIDDIDKLGYTGTDENERRIMTQLMNDLLKFMGEPHNRGRILWIGASNRPDFINPEFRRQGILDDVLPFILPDVGGREDILRKIFPRNGIPHDPNINFGAIAGRTERCTGGDLEIIVMRSFQNAHISNRDVVVEQDIAKAVSEFVLPRDPNMDEYLMLLAIREASILPLVPRQLPGTMSERVFENNVINKTKVNQRIRELELFFNIQSKK